ncbi:hypothetical protein EMCRGX_G012703 [Ephydatia muelleri]
MLSLKMATAAGCRFSLGMTFSSEAEKDAFKLRVDSARRIYTGDEDKDDQRLCVVEHKAISSFEEEDDAIDELMSPDDSTLLDGEYVDSESEEYQEDDDNDA